MREEILRVLKGWDRQNMWYGYEYLADETGFTVKELKKEMRAMRKDGLVKLVATFGDDNLVQGRGYTLVD